MRGEVATQSDDSPAREALFITHTRKCAEELGLLCLRDPEVETGLVESLEVSISISRIASCVFSKEVITGAAHGKHEQLAFLILVCTEGKDSTLKRVSLIRLFPSFGYHRSNCY